MAGVKIQKDQQFSYLDNSQILKAAMTDSVQSLKVYNGISDVPASFNNVDLTYNGNGSCTKAVFYQGLETQVVSVRTIDALTINNSYFPLYSANNEGKYIVWYNTGTGTPPVDPLATILEVEIDAGDSKEIVAVATKLVLDKIEDFKVERNFDFLIISNTERGESNYGPFTFSPFIFNRDNTGSNQIIKQLDIPYENGIKYVFNQIDKRFDVFPATSGNVTISDANGDELEVNPDGSINVVVQNSSGMTLVSLYDEVTNIVSGITTLIGTYTASANALLQKIEFSGTNIAEFEIQIDGSTQDKKRTYFGSSLNGNFNFDSGLEITSGQVIEVYVVHNRPNPGDFNSRIQILEG